MCKNMSCHVSFRFGKARETCWKTKTRKTKEKTKKKDNPAVEKKEERERENHKRKIRSSGSLTGLAAKFTIAFLSERERLERLGSAL